jgi:23S rRNA pseudouridine1911/1915/1917 synthase
VTVGGAPKVKSYRVQAGDEIEFEPPARAPGLQPVTLDLHIPYEDEHLLVVDKPAGVVVHPGAGRTHDTLAGALLEAGAAGGAEERPGIVHRLDRDTSGLLVVARSEGAYERLRELVRDRALEREYVALVRGRPRSRSGRIEAPIGRDRRDPTRQSLDSDSPKEAVTLFQVLELLPRHSLLRVRLETGRMHQIRVHLSAIGLPVAGDPTYGVAGDLDLNRQFLHASRLAFEHPFSRRRLEVESPLPHDLEAALRRARAG